MEIKETEFEKKLALAEEFDCEAAYYVATCYELGKGTEQNLLEAFNWYKEAAVANHPKAQYSLAKMYEDGNGIEIDNDKAIEWYEKAFDNGIEEAGDRLLVCFSRDTYTVVELDREVGSLDIKRKDISHILKHQNFIERKSMDKKNREAHYLNGVIELCKNSHFIEAAYYFKQAVDNNLASAYYELAIILYFGIGVKKDIEKAKHYLFISSVKCLDSFYLLGLIEELEWEMGKGTKELLTNYEAAAKRGHIMAMYALGELYYRDEKLKQDLTKAMEYYKIAADKGYAPAQYSLAVFYFNGFVGESNPVEAMKYCNMAASQDYGKAQCLLGELYYYGKGVEEDKYKAIDWYTKAARAGVAQAIYNLGVFYHEGAWLEKDDDKAMDLYMKAAKKGYAPANITIGSMYYHGENGLEKNLDKAIEYFVEASIKGDDKAFQYLLHCIKEKVNIENDKDLNEIYTKINDLWGDNPDLLDKINKALNAKEKTRANSFESMKREAENGNATAQFALGTFYIEGALAESDIKEAIKWLEKSAEQEHPYAQYLLGVLYCANEFGVFDYELGKSYLTRAARNGSKEAEEMLAELFKLEEENK